jgi:DNA repair protein RadD
VSFHFVPRNYQALARDSVWEYFSSGETGNPVVAMPTGTGKSIVIADLARVIITTWNSQRILVLAPSKELVQQNAEKLESIAPHLPFGICSASLGRYDTSQPVVFATIGTIINRIDALGFIDLIFVDECHLVSAVETTQYRKFFEALLLVNPNLKIIGFSATPYRLGVGHIIDGGLFTHVCHDATTLDAFNWFIEQGYLLPLIPRPTATRLSTDGLKTIAGDYSEKAQQDKFNKAAITQAVIDEARELAHDRRKILIFCTGIEHAENIRDYLESVGESAVAVHSKSATRDDDLAAFMSFGGNGVRWCVNYGVLTTGFDFPDLDCIVVMRVTKSPGLWVQILGRGTRPAYALGFDLSDMEGRFLAIAQSEKQNCLVLDFGYNTAVLGPINDPKIPKKKGTGGGMAPVKTCKAENTEEKAGCGVWNHPSARTCVNCGATFKFEVKFETGAANTEILAGPFEKPVVVEHAVKRVSYEVHEKPGRPNSIRATYYCGLRRFVHYLCPEHGGTPRRRAADFWMRHGGGVAPMTTAECLPLVDDLQQPRFVRVWENTRYPQILDWIM